MPAAIRAPVDRDLPALAALWTRAWRDGHVDITPPALIAMRTRDSLRARLVEHWADLRVAGPEGAPLGFQIQLGPQLYQLYVAQEARGSGLAATLLQDAERGIAATGAATGWLACAIGNVRAARFYEKHGWRCSGEKDIGVAGIGRTFPLTVWIYEKPLHRDAATGGPL